MHAWHLWVIAAIILFIVEIYTPGFILASIGVACLASAAAALFGGGIYVQLITFSIANLVLFFALRPLFMKFLQSRNSTQVKTNVDALIGRIVTVVETIDNSANSGRVIIGGENWRAKSIDNTVFEAGTSVKIVSVSGATVCVKRTL
jgi:membrane protein implicated in regulation of membrane protease activity